MGMHQLQSFEEAKSAMLMTKPVMLVTDESCSFWYSELQSSAVTSLRWHFFIGSFSSGFMKTSNVSTAETFLKHTMRSISFDHFWAPEDAAIVCFTSGTTGKPKGVIISHSALMVQSMAKVAILGYSEDDVYLHTTPLCHIGGLSSALAMLMVGACHVLIPKFKVAVAVDAIEKQCVTSLITVPAIMADLVSLSRVNGKWEERQSVKKILNGGGSLSDEPIKSAIKLFPRAKIFSAYAMLSLLKHGWDRPMQNGLGSLHFFFCSSYIHYYLPNISIYWNYRSHSYFSSLFL
uniref:2-succinylbenzoateCoA ligaseic/peroxisomal-like isoform X5 n=1 Tax=Rhizophora mucronata TaxID=61149 RepID=A0A2P2LMI1_RHIMU